MNLTQAEQRAVAELVQPKPWKCIRDKEHVSHLGRCKGCDFTSGKVPDKCKFPDPVDTNDWNLIMEWMRKTKGFGEALYQWYGKEHDMFESIDEMLAIDNCARAWILDEATPADLWRIILAT